MFFTFPESDGFLLVEFLKWLFIIIWGFCICTSSFVKVNTLIRCVLTTMLMYLTSMWFIASFHMISWVYMSDPNRRELLSDFTTVVGLLSDWYPFLWKKDEKCCWWKLGLDLLHWTSVYFLIFKVYFA